MKQAKVLTEKDVKLVLAHIARNSFANRNRAMFLLMLHSGMRVGEIAALSVSDVVDSHGKVREQILLRAHQTKGNEARTVLLNAQARRNSPIPA